ncbi:MAG: type IV secretory system conjugative DNA transfer family protein [Rhodospirillales bacterium]|nr:type IV secretory system conjugative DNA transfer family protein [Rhodospirillales bacterium]
MRLIQPGLCVLLLAAGAGWSSWLTSGVRPEDMAAAGLGTAVVASFAAYMATDRKDAAIWLRFGLYGGALAVACASFWTGVVRPLQHVPSLGAVMVWLDRLDGIGLVLLVAPGPAVVLLLVLWFEVAVASLRHLGGGDRRRRAESDLHGRAALLGRRFLRRLAKRNGILLGQWGGRQGAPLIGWALEGSAITVAPPRTGKGALIALNLLSPGNRGFDGSTVTIDPRGELWCIASRRRRQMGRRAVLLDPFGVAKDHKREYGKDCHLPDVKSATYNPLEFIRKDEGHAVRDINVLLDALLTPPRPGAHDNSRHFYESARAIIAGYIAWVRFREPGEKRNLKRVHELLSQTPEKRKTFAAKMAMEAPFAGGLAHIAVERQAQVGAEEGGSNFTTIANQLAFLNYPELLANTARSSFDPLSLADGGTDLFVVVPEDAVEHVKGWLRLWVAIPNAMAARKPLKRDMLIVIDEMPRIGFLKPVMDGYTMAAGKGVHFWCFAQSISALDSSWGKEHRRTLLHLAEVVQVLGFPRTDAEGAEELSKAIGTATFENRTESRSGTIAESRVLSANTQWQAGESLGLVRERLVTPDELMTLGADRQYVIAAPKDMPRDALHLHHARYWRRPDAEFHADPNPFVVRKERAAKGAAGGRADPPVARVRAALRRILEGRPGKRLRWRRP